jgi:sortase A
MALRIIGRGFIGFGTIILLFLLYQLIGTNFVTGRQQKALAGELEDQWAKGITAEEDKPNLGEGMSIIRIPKIGVDQIVVEGVEVEDLKKGPGHYPDTALPGQLGNMVISGHRTTYGAPFYRLDELQPGDDIIVYDAKGPYTYKVSETRIVLPTEIGVIAPSSDARLTLTTCHPRFSAAKRLIVVAQLQGTPTGLQTTDPGVGPLPEA